MGMLIAVFAAVGRARRNIVDPLSWQSRGSYASAYSAYSFLSVGSVLSAGSVLSIGSAGSILSIGSAGSILSIGSAGSVLSIGSLGSVLSLGRASDAGRIAAVQKEVANDLSRISARLRSGAKRWNASRLPSRFAEAFRTAGGSLAR